MVKTTLLILGFAALLTAAAQLNEAFAEYDVALRLDPTPSAEHLSNLGG